MHIVYHNLSTNAKYRSVQLRLKIIVSLLLIASHESISLITSQGKNNDFKLNSIMLTNAQDGRNKR